VKSNDSNDSAIAVKLDGSRQPGRPARVVFELSKSHLKKIPIARPTIGEVNSKEPFRARPIASQGRSQELGAQRSESQASGFDFVHRYQTLAA